MNGVEIVGRMVPPWKVAGAVFGTSLALGAVGTAVWSGDGHRTARDAIANASYLPGIVGGITALGAAPLLLTKWHDGGEKTLLTGAAAAAGMVAGVAGARMLGLGAQAAVDGVRNLPVADDAQARREAADVLASIDFSRPDIVIWAPGTMRYSIPPEFADAVHAQFGGAASLVKLPTLTTYAERQGVSQTQATLRYVLDGIAAHAGSHRVLLAGESEGGWAVNEVVADPTYRPLIDRAVTWGTPGMTPHHYLDGHDPDVLELADDYDVVTKPVKGDVNDTLGAMEATFDGRLSQAWKLPAALVNNPYSALLLLETGIRRPLPGGYDRDPHNYREFMPAAAAMLAGQAVHPHQAGAGANAVTASH